MSARAVTISVSANASVVLSMTQGEDVSVTCQTSPAETTSGWTVSAYVTDPATGAIALTKSGTPSGTTVVFAVAAADTLHLSPNLYPLSIRRTDSGSQNQLAHGYLQLTPTISR